MSNHVAIAATNQTTLPVLATLKGSNICAAEGLTSSSVIGLCRALVAAGVDEARPMFAYRGATLAIRVRSIGEGAKLTVKEDGKRSPRFCTYRPFTGAQQMSAVSPADALN